MSNEQTSLAAQPLRYSAFSDRGMVHTGLFVDRQSEADGFITRDETARTDESTKRMKDSLQLGYVLEYMYSYKRVR